MAQTTHEPVTEKHHRHAYERMMVLSDGVFAIAVTLLAFDIRPTGAIGGDWRSLLSALTPKLEAYAVSFVVAALFWTGQRRTFARLLRIDGAFVWLTLLFLGLVALIPAASSMLYAIPGRGPPTIYIGLIMLLSTVQALSWGYAAFIGKLAAADVTQAQRVYVFLIALLTPSIFAGLSLLGLYQGGRLGAGVWFILIVVVVTVRIASRRILKDLRY
jgi:uncharacterized membrane protein